MTNAIPPTSGESTTASVTARTGGVSMITQSNRPLFVSSSSVRIWSEPSSSDGFGGGSPGRQHPEFRVIERDQGGIHRGLTGQDVREPGAVLDVQRAMHAGAPHVGIDHQHPRSANRQGERQIARGRRLALERLRARHHHAAASAPARC